MGVNNSLGPFKVTFRPMAHRLATGLVLLAAATAAAAPRAAAERNPVVMQVQPGVARPGDAVLVTLRGVRCCPTGWLGKSRLNFMPSRGGFQAITGVPVESKPGPLELKVQYPARAR